MSIPAYSTYRESELAPDGLLPAHWGQGPIKRLFTVTLGKMVTSSERIETRSTRPYLRSSNVQSGYLALEDTKAMWFSEAEATSLTLQSGDLVVCEGGDVGRCTLLAEDLPGYGFQNSVNRIRARAAFQASTAFLGYWLKTLKLTLSAIGRPLRTTRPISLRAQLPLSRLLMISVPSSPSSTARRPRSTSLSPSRSALSGC